MLTLQCPSSDLDRADPHASFMFDRRIGVRQPAEGAILASARGESGTRLVQLLLLDSSHAGLGAISQTRLAPGSHISLHGVDAGWTRSAAIVARCDEHPEGGYRIGIAFDTRMAA